uniref:Uncharacterized protein n=1 Tax=Setaria italica TaxID=4555 RepID=K3YBN9_SETIT
MRRATAEMKETTVASSTRDPTGILRGSEVVCGSTHCLRPSASGPRSPSPS